MFSSASINFQIFPAGKLQTKKKHYHIKILILLFSISRVRYTYNIYMVYSRYVVPLFFECYYIFFSRISFDYYIFCVEYMYSTLPKIRMDIFACKIVKLVSQSQLYKVYKNWFRKDFLLRIKVFCVQLI